MVSPYALLVVALGLLWIAGEPLPTHSRALAGDGVPGLLFAVLALGAVAVSRFGRNAPHPPLEGPPAFAALGAREPMLVTGLAALGALALGGLDSIHGWLGALLWMGVSAWFARAGDSRRSAVLPVCALALCLLPVGSVATMPLWLALGFIGAAWLAFAVQYNVANRWGTTHAERLWRVVLPVGALLSLPITWYGLRETAFWLNPYHYVAYPVIWLFLWSIGEGVRALFWRRLDPASASLRVGRRIGFSTRAWVWLLGLQLGGGVARQFGVPDSNVLLVALILSVVVAVALALGTAAQRSFSEQPDHVPGGRSPLLLAVAPMLAPLLVLGCLRIAPLPGAWGEFSDLRGTIALLAPALALPLGGAVLLVAACIDRTRGRGFPVLAGAIGALLLIAGGFAVGPFVSRWHTEFAAAGLAVAGLAPWAAVLMGLAAAAVDQRLRQVQSGQPLRTWSVALLPVVALGTSTILVPSIGLIGALLATSSGVVATMLADRLPLLRRARVAHTA
ncbi:MAG: hypothetical protein GC161_15515 [Planctomycetaceae bacterium]|nr:hypothetical protein [Planctomycetaceae bacterium]